ncbi:MAG: HlyD family efflux transporter periplasmic adaptor subunit [Rhizobiales bacterium]|nr:HlyD family efflux transporter periplasmic adaptor subunit [Hyphomicrobiales bacterium]
MLTHKILGVAALGFGLLLAGCGEDNKAAEGEQASAAEYERGSHRGRMLRDGNFAVEITIFEDGVEPEFHIYSYRDDKPIAPVEVQLGVMLSRLGGRVDQFSFTPREDYLRGNGVVREPHSFDVRVTAVEGGRTHSWSYASYEGRTTISAEAARQGGVKSERAGPAVVGELITMSGRVEIVPEGKANVRAVYPGRIVQMQAELGQQVKRGQVLARVESSSSLQTYSVTAPIGGVVVEKNANIGEVTGTQALLVIADPTQLHAEFFVYPRDAERIKVGQPVRVRNLAGDAEITAKVEATLPTASLTSQTLIAHVHLPPSVSTAFRAGMGVNGAFEVGTQQVPLAVRTKAIQRFRDFEVVYAKVGNTYEVRMLEIGRRTPEWTEVTGGLEGGTEYVTDGAFLIRADVEKSGASHDH